MKLYSLRYDGQDQYIEARSMGEAIAIWHAWAKNEWRDEYNGSEEPEQVVLVHDEAVIRASDADLELPPFCEGHDGRAAVGQDPEGVPLCQECMDELTKPPAVRPPPPPGTMCSDCKTAPATYYTPDGSPLCHTCMPF